MVYRTETEILQKKYIVTFGELFLKPSDIIRPDSTIGSLTSKYCLIESPKVKQFHSPSLRRRPHQKYIKSWVLGRTWQNWLITFAYPSKILEKAKKCKIGLNFWAQWRFSGMYMKYLYEIWNI